MSRYWFRSIYFLVRFVFSFTDSLIYWVVQINFPCSVSRRNWFRSVEIFCVRKIRISLVEILVAFDEFHSAVGMSVAALSADWSCPPPQVVVALEILVASRVINRVFWPLEVLDFVVFASVTPFAAHRDAVGISALTAGFDFANFLVWLALLNDAVVLAIDPVCFQTGEAGLAGDHSWVVVVHRARVGSVIKISVKILGLEKYFSLLFTNNNSRLKMKKKIFLFFK